MTLKQWNRRFERPHNRGRELTAAAVSIDATNTDDRHYLEAVVAKSKNEAVQPWKYYEGIGEVHYSVNRSARIAGYANLYIEQADENGVWHEVNRNPARAILESIYSSVGGVRGFIDRWYGLQKVPADSHLVRVRDGDGDHDGYEFISADEIDATSLSEISTRRDASRPLRWITMPGSTGYTGRPFGRDIAPGDYLGRMWTPSRRWQDVPDTPLNSMHTECDVLMILTRLLKARLRQRFALAGLLFIPQDITEARISGMGGNDGVIRKDDILNYLRKAMTANVTDWDTAMALTPILVRGPKEAAEAIRHITIDQELSATDLELRQELIGRILFGLDITQQATAGVGGQNHWGAWAVSDEERRIAVQPDLENLCWGLTRLILHPQLVEVGKLTPDAAVRYRINFDLSDSAVRSNQQEDARQLHDRSAISDNALRRVTGFDPRDEPTDDDMVRMAGRLAKNPRLMLWGLPVYDEIPWDDIIPPKQDGPLPDSDGSDPKAGPGVGQPGSPDDNDSDTPRSERPA